MAPTPEFACGQWLQDPSGHTWHHGRSTLQPTVAQRVQTSDGAGLTGTISSLSCILDNEESKTEIVYTKTPTGAGGSGMPDVSGAPRPLPVTP